MQHHHTIIAGGGMAGMACGLKLREGGISPLMITETLGGRVCYNPEQDMNYGAVFYMESYHNARKILTAGERLFSSYFQVKCHRTETDCYPLVSLRMLRNLPQLVSFLRFMQRRFIPNYEAYKKYCETLPVREAMEKVPFIKELYFITAQELLKRLKLPRATGDVISLFVFGCTGTSVPTLNALDYCNCAQGLVMPIYRFKLDEDATEKKIGMIERDTVTAVGREGKLHSVTTASGKQYTCDNLVLATPAVVTQKLLGLPAIRRSSQLISYLLRGVPKQKYRKHDVHCFSDLIPLIFFYHRQNGKQEYEIFSTHEININDYFDSYELLGSKEWPHALYVKGDVIMEQDLGEGLYTAGDHNGLGMEPTTISGLFAANRILAKNA